MIKRLSCAICMLLLVVSIGCEADIKSNQGKEAEGNKVINIEARKADTLDAVHTYIVEWTSRYGKYSSDTKQRFEAFTNKSDAEKFAKELKSAFKLIKHTSGTKVKVYKSE